MYEETFDKLSFKAPQMLLYNCSSKGSSFNYEHLMRTQTKNSQFPYLIMIIIIKGFDSEYSFSYQVIYEKRLALNLYVYPIHRLMMKVPNARIFKFQTSIESFKWLVLIFSS